MAGRLRRFALSLALGAMCAGLAAVLWWPVSPVRPGLPLHSGSADVPALPPEPSVALAPKSEFSLIAERPLFQPSRRPFIAATVAAPPPPAPAPPPPPAIRAYTVVGVMVSGSRRLAWLKPPAGGSPARVAEGDVVQGWRVKQIDKDRVTFEAGALEHVLTLAKRGGTTSTAPGARR